MRKIILYLQISLDGVVSDVDQWMTLNDDIVEDALEYYDAVDTIVVGGNTYPSMAEYWQNAEKSSDSDLERTVAKRINEMKKVVISRSKINHLVWNNSKQLIIDDNESLVPEIENLKNSEGKNISVESGVKTWQLFLQNSLFDELWLFVHPVVAAQGKCPTCTFKTVADMPSSSLILKLAFHVLDITLTSSLCGRICPILYQNPRWVKIKTSGATPPPVHSRYSSKPA